MSSTSSPWKRTNDEVHIAQDNVVFCRLCLALAVALFYWIMLCRWFNAIWERQDGVAIWQHYCLLLQSRARKSSVGDVGRPCPLLNTKEILIKFDGLAAPVNWAEIHVQRPTLLGPADTGEAILAFPAIFFSFILLEEWVAEKSGIIYRGRL